MNSSRYNMISRLLCLVLAFAVLFSTVPQSAYAADPVNPDGALCVWDYPGDQVIKAGTCKEYKYEDGYFDWRNAVIGAIPGAAIGLVTCCGPVGVAAAVLGAAIGSLFETTNTFTVYDCPPEVDQTISHYDCKLDKVTGQLTCEVGISGSLKADILGIQIYSPGSTTTGYLQVDMVNVGNPIFTLYHSPQRQSSGQLTEIFPDDELISTTTQLNNIFDIAEVYDPSSSEQVIKFSFDIDDAVTKSGQSLNMGYTGNGMKISLTTRGDIYGWGVAYSGVQTYTSTVENCSAEFDCSNHANQSFEVNKNGLVPTGDITPGNQPWAPLINISGSNLKLMLTRNPSDAELTTPANDGNGAGNVTYQSKVVAVDNSSGGSVTFTFNEPTKVDEIGLLNLKTATTVMGLDEQGGMVYNYNVPLAGSKPANSHIEFQPNNFAAVAGQRLKPVKSLVVTSGNRFAVTHISFCPVVCIDEDDCGICKGDEGWNEGPDSCGLCPFDNDFGEGKDECNLCPVDPGYNQGEDGCGYCPQDPEYEQGPDECELCPGDRGFGLGEDECELCPNDEGYGLGEDECGYCPQDRGYELGPDACDLCPGDEGFGDGLDECDRCPGDEYYGWPPDKCGRCEGQDPDFGNPICDCPNDKPRDECGYCPGEPNYGKGKDECNLCPEDRGYGLGKDVCGYCPGEKYYGDGKDECDRCQPDKFYGWAPDSCNRCEPDPDFGNPICPCPDGKPDLGCGCGMPKPDDCGLCKGDPGYGKGKDECGFCPDHKDYGKGKDECGLCPGMPNYGEGKDDCGLCPKDPNYGKGKDECGFCPGDKDYGKGKDECELCPGDRGYGLGEDVCGYCPGEKYYGDGKDECDRCQPDKYYGWAPDSCNRCEPDPDFGNPDCGCPNDKPRDECGFCPGEPGYGEGKDECGLCPNDPDYEKGKDECGFCPDHKDYGKGKDECGFCPGQPFYGVGKDDCGRCKPDPDFGDPVCPCPDGKPDLGCGCGKPAPDECGTCGGTGTDECGICPGKPGYGEGEDECGFCPNEPGYGEGKDECELCPSEPGYGDGEDECGFCPQDPDYEVGPDECGICPGDDGHGLGPDECKLCPQDDFYGKGPDECDRCPEDPEFGQPCDDCPEGEDLCGVCGGDNTTCCNLENYSSQQFSIDGNLHTMNQGNLRTLLRRWKNQCQKNGTWGTAKQRKYRSYSAMGQAEQNKGWSATWSVQSIQARCSDVECSGVENTSSIEQVQASSAEILALVLKVEDMLQKQAGKRPADKKVVQAARRSNKENQALSETLPDFTQQCFADAQNFQ